MEHAPVPWMPPPLSTDTFLKLSISTPVSMDRRVYFKRRGLIFLLNFYMFIAIILYKMSAPNYRLIIIYFSAEFWPTKELFQVRPQLMMYVYFFKQVRLNSTNNKRTWFFVSTISYYCNCRSRLPRLRLKKS